MFNGYLLPQSVYLTGTSTGQEESYGPCSSIVTTMQEENYDFNILINSSKM